MELTLFSASLVLLLVILLTFYNWRNRSIRYPPGPATIPFLGSGHKLTEKRHLALMDMAKTYGNLITLKFFHHTYVGVVGYEANRALFDRAKEISDRGSLDFFGGIKWDGEKQAGLVDGPYGPEWSAHRKLFHTVTREIGKGRRGVELIIQEEASNLVQEFDRVIEPGKPCDPFIMISIAVLNVIASFIFGDRYAYDDKKMKRLITINNDIFQSDGVMKDPLYFLTSVIPALRKIWMPKSVTTVRNKIQKLVDFCAEEVEQHKKYLDSNAPKDFIDYYLLKMKNQAVGDKPIYSEHGLHITLLDLFMAGADTTTTTLRWVILYLAGHQDVQGKVREEIDQVLGFDKEAKYEDRLKMPYTEATIHEIQRVSTILPIGVTHIANRDLEFQGFRIPKGTGFMPNLYSSHFQEDQWIKAREFYPENFLDEEGKFVLRDAFMQFGGGNRICPGMAIAKQELFLFLVSILQKYKIVPENESCVDYEPVLGILSYPKQQKYFFINRE